MKPATLAILCSCLLAGSHAADILAFAVSNSYSHFIVMEPLFKELAARGHHITVVNSFPQKPPLPNYHDFNVGHLLNPVLNNFSFHTASQFGHDPFTNMYKIWEAGTGMCERILQSGALKEMYNSTTHYDLVITHVFSYECFSVFANKFDTPIVSIVTSSALPWSNPRVGNPDHPGYVVNNYIDADENMSLYQRTVNTLAWIWSTFAIHPLSYSKTDDLVHRYLDPAAPPAREIMKRTSLVMVNSHFSILQSRAFTPNFIEIGGIHVKEPKPLPKDLKDFLDGASQGAIVFSLGSLVRASSMTNNSFQALMDAFAALPQRVVFKFEEELVNIPSNVMVRKWLPQRDILEHPKVRVLMAHGGQSSTIEAVYTGTPLVGLPFFSDQYSNIQSLVLRGAAVLLNFQDLTKEKVLTALKTVLDDPRYKMNAERLSSQFRDRPVSPLQSAVYWTEYVLRHQGAPQLRSRAADMPWYKFLLLDVAAVLLPFLILAYYVFRVLVKYTLYCLFGVFISTKKSKYD